MRKVETTHFDKGGSENTQSTLRAAKERTAEINLEAVIVDVKR